jgi:putative hydrolase of the HAD superfamily
MARPAGLILDYGNVLTRPQDQAWMERAAEGLGASVPAFRSAYWRYRHDYDADLPAREYWRRVIAASRATGDGVLSEPDLRRLIAADVDSWVDYHNEVWGLAAEFHRAGGRAALLSNSGPEVMARVRADHPLEARFDAVVISCEVGLAKPDPRIYRLCLERLGLPPQEALFVDDRLDNIEAAALVGLRTVQFEGADALDQLRALIR